MINRPPFSAPRRARALAPLLPILVAAVLGAAPAQASTSVAGTGEPAFTNTTTNTHFIGYNRFSSYYSFRPYYSYYIGAGASYSEYGGSIGTPGSQSTGTLFANWQGVVNTLVNGTYYGICVSGQYTFDSGGPEFPESQSSCGEGIISGKNSGTTIDLTKPVVSSVAVEGAATYTNKTTLALSGLYSDSLAPPWPAVYTCIKENLDPASACGGVIYDYTQVCSNAQNGSSTSNNPFSCTYTLGAGSTDGPVTFCARAADASLPDKPGNADQFAGFTSSNANISDPALRLRDRRPRGAAAVDHGRRHDRHGRPVAVAVGVGLGPGGRDRPGFGRRRRLHLVVG